MNSALTKLGGVLVGSGVIAANLPWVLLGVTVYGAIAALTSSDQ